MAQLLRCHNRSSTGHFLKLKKNVSPGRRHTIRSLSVLEMQRRELKPKDVILGGIWMGPGSGPNGDGVRDDLGQQNANELVRAAVEAGIKEFDTAPWYGAGASEERLGKAIIAEGLEREILVHTKIGRLFTEQDGSVAGPKFNPETLPSRVVSNDYSANGVRKSLQESLARMGVSEFYGLRIHDPNDNNINRFGDPNFKDEVAEVLDKESGALSELIKMRENGNIKHLSLGMNCNKEQHQGVPDEIIRLLRKTDLGTFDSALLAGGWNLLSQAGLPCYLECQDRSVGIHVAGCFASGYLVTKSGTYAYRPASEDIQLRTEKWRAVAANHGCSLPSVAIAFSAMPKIVRKVVLGIATKEQLDQNLEWIEESNRVPLEIWAEAKNLELIVSAIPIQGCS